jgi:hypothetical protein
LSYENILSSIQSGLIWLVLLLIKVKGKKFGKLRKLYSVLILPGKKGFSGFYFFFEVKKLREPLEVCDFARKKLFYT